MGTGVQISPTRLAQARHKVIVDGRPLSQAKAADRIGVHWVTWANWERGKYPPSYENVRRICAELNVTLADLTADASGAGEVAADARPFRPGSTA